VSDCLTPLEQFFSYIVRSDIIKRTSHNWMRWWCECALCTRPTRLVFSAKSVKQQRAGRHVDSLGHISQPVFALTS